MKNITHLYFDLDHTLWDTDRNAEESLSELFHELELQSLGFSGFDKFHEVYKNNNEKLWGLYAENKIGKEAVRVNRFKNTFQEFGIDNDHLVNKLADQFISITPRKSNLIDGTIELLESIKGRYHLSIITNGFKESQHTKMQASGLHKYFEHVFISEVVGINKPDPGIFRYVMEATGASSPQNCLMIGDTYETDIVGALNAGMRAVHLMSGTKTGSAHRDVITIHHLKELQELL